jgi:hypothetical protein
MLTEQEQIELQKKLASAITLIQNLTSDIPSRKESHLEAAKLFIDTMPWDIGELDYLHLKMGSFGRYGSTYCHLCGTALNEKEVIDLRCTDFNTCCSDHVEFVGMFEREEAQKIVRDRIKDRIRANK